MSPLTIFLAKLLWLYCVILALTTMPRKQGSVATIKALIANPPLLLFYEVLALAAGLAMILGHNIWSGRALPVVVTLVGWLIAIWGAGLLVLSPSATMKLFEAMRHKAYFLFTRAPRLFCVFIRRLRVLARERRYLSPA